MIITGYIGQYYEVTNPTAFFIWGAVSTVFFIHILILMRRVIKEGKEGIPEDAQKTLGSIWTLFWCPGFSIRAPISCRTYSACSTSPDCITKVAWSADRSPIRLRIFLQKVSMGCC